MSAQKPRPIGVLGGLLGLVGFSAIAGVLVAVMVTPALAVTSVAANNTISVFDDLPEYLEIGTPPQQNIIYAVNGYKADKSPKYKAIATVYSQNRKEISWDEVTPTLKNAVLAAEDRRFYDHGGIDLQGITRAAAKNIFGGSLQGASTLTQQLVKNVCITTAVTDYSGNDDQSTKLRNDAIGKCQDVSFDRKIKEMKLAIGLEKRYTKDQILLAYLNIAGFGGNIYGIESAAEVYYNTDAKDLTVAQAASLVGIVQLPTKRRLDISANYDRNKARRDVIIDNMFDYGMIDQAARDKALATPVNAKTVTLNPPSNGCIAANQYAKQFCDYIVESIKDLDSLGKTAAERQANWKIGGYSIYTTLDLKLNKVAQNTLRAYAPAKETRLQLGASAVSIEPGTGHIITMAQNKVFDNQGEGKNGARAGTSAINFNTDYAHGGSGGFQPGSSYKLFTLLNWLEAGHGLDEVVNVTPVKTPQANFDATGCGGPYGGYYSPRNDSNEKGPYTVRQATARSINGGYVQMALQLSLCKTRDIALALGIRLAAPVADNPKTSVDEARSTSDLYTGPSSILGIDPIAPMNIAAAFATVAANGVYCKPIAVVKIVDAKGAQLPGQAQDCSTQVDPEVAAAAADGLSTGGSTYAGNPRDGTPYIGKTGTTNASQQTWLTMSSTALTTTVWYGNITGNFPIRNYCGGSAGCDNGQQRHKIMHAILAAADKTYKGHAFPAATSRLLHGVNVKVGNYVGMAEADAKAAIEGLKLKYVNKGEIASAEPKGTIAKQDPAEGQPLSLGQTVTVWTSDGSKGTVPDVTTTPMDFPTAQAAVVAAGFANVEQQCVATPLQDGTINPATGQLANPALPADNQVVGVSPSAGTVLKSTKTVTLQVAHASC